jgi:hypothetical protein
VLGAHLVTSWLDPTTTLLSLTAVATLNAPPSVPRFRLVDPSVRNARIAPLPSAAWPTTLPPPLMPSAALSSPPNVPRSVRVPLAYRAARFAPRLSAPGVARAVTAICRRC